MKQRSPVIFPALFSIAILAGAIWLVMEQLHWPWWIGYLAGINLATFFVYAYDKWVSGGTRTRVPENVLHILALFGGTPAAWAAQRVFRHKTIKRSFRVRFWLIAGAQLAALIGWAVLVLTRDKPNGIKYLSALFLAKFFPHFPARAR